jgi:hypothetical protein
MAAVANDDPLQRSESPLRDRSYAGGSSNSSSPASPHAHGNAFDGDMMEERTLVRCFDSRPVVAAARQSLSSSPISEQQHYVFTVVESEANSSASSKPGSACGTPSGGSSVAAVISDGDDDGWQPTARVSQRRGTQTGAAGTQLAEKCSSALRPTHRIPSTLKPRAAKEGN